MCTGAGGERRMNSMFHVFIAKWTVTVSLYIRIYIYILFLVCQYDLLLFLYRCLIYIYKMGTKCLHAFNGKSFFRFMWTYFSTDALHLSIPAQGLPNGDAALQHAAYPGMQPYPGVGKWIVIDTRKNNYKDICDSSV